MWQEILSRDLWTLNPNPNSNLTLRKRTNQQAKGTIVDSSILTQAIGFSPDLPLLCSWGVKYPGHAMPIVPLTLNFKFCHCFGQIKYCMVWKATCLFVCLQGNANDSLSYHHDSKFSTKDQDNDIFDDHCAQTFKGAWWYKTCHVSNLNGRYLKGKHSSFADGVNWRTWKGYHYSVKRAEMKMKPVNDHNWVSWLEVLL